MKTDSVLRNGDLAALQQLNDDFIKSVRLSDVRRFEEYWRTIS